MSRTVIEEFEKQPAEKFFIGAYITLEIGESIVIGNCSVSAVDKDGADVTSTVLDSATMAVASSPDGTNDAVIIKVQAGTEALSPYKLTFIIVTNTPNEYEVDVRMSIFET